MVRSIMTPTQVRFCFSWRQDGGYVLNCCNFQFTTVIINVSQVNTLYCLVLREKLYRSLLKCRMIWQIVGASWCPQQYKRLPVKLCALTEFSSNIFARLRRITFKLCKFTYFRRFWPIEWIVIAYWSWLKLKKTNGERVSHLLLILLVSFSPGGGGTRRKIG